MSHVENVTISAGSPVQLEVALVPTSTAAVSYCTPGTTASGCTALLSGTGTPSASAASGFDVLASTVEGQKDGLFFFGTNGPQANSWGSGTSFQCVVPPVQRTGLAVGSGTTGLCDGSFNLDFNAWMNATRPRPPPRARP